MGVKKKQADLNTPVRISSQRQEKVEGLSSADPSLLQFLHASCPADQIAALKQVVKTLQQKQQQPSNNDSLKIEVLVDAFLSAPLKNQMKRAVASSLQSLPTEKHLVIREEICQQVRKLMFLSGSDTETSRSEELSLRRQVVDIITSLLENFPLGETSIRSMPLEGLSFLSDTLKVFYTEVRQSTSPVELTVRTHDCYATTQSFNKLSQKASEQLQRIVRTQEIIGDVSENKQKEKLMEIFRKATQTFFAILSDESCMLDCRATCGVAVPLVIKIVYGDAVVKQIQQHLIRSKTEVISITHQGESLLEGTDVSSLPLSSYICLLNGVLAMLDLSDLVTECGDNGQLFLVDVVGRELLELEESLTDSYAKLSASKTLSVLTGKMCAALEAYPHDNHNNLKSHLHGNAPVIQSLLNYTWNHWEDSVDTIRHQARTVFNNLLKCHLLATGESPEKSQFLHQMATSLLGMSWQSKGKYGPMCCIVTHLGSCQMLRLEPELPTLTLTAVGEQVLANAASELFEKLFSCHLRELESCADPSLVLPQWHTTWVNPLLTALCHGSSRQKTFLIEYVVPRVLKFSPWSIRYITSELGTSATVCQGERLGALITCLKRAKSQGILTLKAFSQDDKLWNGVVPLTVLKQALCHANEQVCLDAFGLLCEHHKTTEVIPETDLDLVQFFLPLNMCSQTPSFRQQLGALLKKLFIRLHEGGKALQRNYSLAKERGKDAEGFYSSLQTYRKFLQWLCSHLFSCLHPAASFPSRTTSLSTLSLLVNILGAHDLSASRKEEFYVVEVMTPERIQTLLECLTDSFEANKMEAYTVLSALPETYLRMEDPARLQSLLQCGLDLACSTRPQDCTTAAYLLRLLARHSNIGTCQSLTDTDDKPDELTSGVDEGHSMAHKGHSVPHEGHSVQQEGHSVPHEGHLVLLQTLVRQLKEQLSTARQSLLHAAATKPLYPTMHCIRYLLGDVDLRLHSDDRQWRHLVSDVITTSFSVAELVSPVVSNSSPEGNIPSDAILGPGLTLDAVAQSEEEEHLLRTAQEDSAAKVSLMPEYLIVCCWRSIKEVSLLLGQLTRTAPIMNSPEGAGGEASEDEGTGLVSVTQLHEIGDLFTTQLLESRHRGAFELAYAGFVNMTEMLWKCSVANLHHLPKKWLEEILADIKSRDPNSRLCATRRSAGVPFYVQALVSTEPASTGRSSFKMMMSELLTLAKLPQSETGKENTAQVHALNILRALFRDTRLGDEVFPFIADGLQAAILGYSSQLWGIRNSATLLFSALVVRIFGVKRTRDDLSKKNCMTGRVFFHRFPSLFEFLLRQLELTTQHVGEAGTLHLHPGLYPVLMVLGRLYPSVIEGSDSSLNLKAFVPHVIRCGSSPVYKTRVMAARALQPLVAQDEVVEMLSQLAASLPKSVVETVSQNCVHGCLLQMSCLLEDLTAFVQTDILQSSVLTDLSASCWLATRNNPCYVTRAAFFQISQTLCSYHQSHSPGGSTESPALNTLQDKLHNMVKEELLTKTLPEQRGVPGLTDFYVACCQCLLNNLQASRTLEGNAATLLQSPIYEVRLETVRWLKGNMEYDPSRSKRGDQKFVETKTDCPTFIMRSAAPSQISQDRRVFAQLVTMVMGMEDYPQCLVEVQHTLYLHPLSTTFPWKAVQSYDVKQVFDRLFQLTSHNLDAVRCGSMLLLGCTIPELYRSATQGDQWSLTLLYRWCPLLDTSSTTEQSVQMRHACAQVLAQNASLVLVDNSEVLDCSISLDLWTVTVRLLQDEDPAVRESMTAVMKALHSHIPTQHKEFCGEADVLAPYALHVVLDTMLSILGERAWSRCVVTLLRWIQRDLEPDWPVQDSEVRLFDKGEMNTYRDDTNFALVCAGKLRQFVLSTVTCKDSDMAVTSPDSDSAERTSGDKELKPSEVVPPKKKDLVVTITSSSHAEDGHVKSINEESETIHKPQKTCVPRAANHKERQIFVEECFQGVMTELRLQVERAEVVGPASAFSSDQSSSYQNWVTQLSRNLVAARSLLLPGYDSHDSRDSRDPSDSSSSSSSSGGPRNRMLSNTLQLLAKLLAHLAVRPMSYCHHAASVVRRRRRRRRPVSGVRRPQFTKIATPP